MGSIVGLMDKRHVKAGIVSTNAVQGPETNGFATRRAFLVIQTSLAIFRYGGKVLQNLTQRRKEEKNRLAGGAHGRHALRRTRSSG
jgi:hypothetical protein